MNEHGAAPCVLPGVPGMRIATVETCLQALALLSDRNGGARTASASLLASMHTVLERFVAAGLPQDIGPDGAPRYDLVELRNFVNVADRCFDDPFWRDEATPMGRRLVREALSENAVADRRVDGQVDSQVDSEADFEADPWPPTLPSLGSPLPPRRFRLTVSRTYGAEFLKATASCRLRLPLPLESSTLNELSVTVLAPDEKDRLRSTRHAGRLDVLVDPAKLSTLTIAAASEFVVDPQFPVVPNRSLDPRERTLALAPEEGLIRITPALRALALKLADGATDAMTMLRSFWAYLHAALNIGAIRYTHLDAADPLGSILRLGWADCQLASALFVALCRSQGLPARIVSGYVLQPALPAYHYWAEVWIAERGWLPFDTLGFALSRSGDHSPWRDVFFGRLDYRAPVECLPHLFTGLPGIRLPVAWHQNVRHVDGGIHSRLEDSATGAAVYAEEIRCERLV